MTCGAGRVVVAANIVLGSHTWPRDRCVLPSEVTAVAMRRGSVLLWCGSTLHAASRHAGTEDGYSAGVRQGLLLGYCLSWLRPEMNFHYSIPVSVMRSMNPDMQALCGFAGSNRYGPHPNISGPVYAAEYNGFPDTEVDLGAAENRSSLGQEPPHAVPQSKL